MSDTILKIKGLNKTLGKKQILHSIDMECYSGEVYGFLGPNGAGKTTTIKIAVGLLQLDEGEISINGKDIRKDFEGAMANVGGIVENPEMYKYLSGMENLRQYARMREGVTEERIWLNTFVICALVGFKCENTLYSLYMELLAGIIRQSRICFR